MKRRDLITLLGAAAATGALPAAAQPKRLPVIGFLNNQSPEPWKVLLAAFHRGLKEGGFVEGESVTVQYRWAEGRHDRLPALAADLVAAKVDIIVSCGGPDPAFAAKAATATIPVVFVSGSDPVTTGLVASLARPGANLTGFTLFTSLLGPKRLEILRELVPGPGPIAVLMNPENSNSAAQLVDLRAAAAQLGVALQVHNAGDEPAIAAAFGAVVQSKARALLVSSDAFFYTRPSRVTEIAARHRVPAIYEARVFAEAGGLASYGTDFADVYRQAGRYAARILKGEKPADLPVQQPTKFELVVNLKTAKTLGLTIPPAILLRADDVID